MERITELNFEMMSGKYQKKQLEIEARLKEVMETLPQNGGQRCQKRIVRCAVLNMSLALPYRSIVLLVPRRYRGRNQMRANAGAGNRKGWYVLNCPQKMTD